MVNITFRLNPKVVPSIVEGLRTLSHENFDTLVSIHGGKFSPQQVEELLSRNPELNVQLDIGQKVRITNIWENGNGPDVIGNEEYLSIKKGDLVYVVNPYYYEGKRLSSEVRDSVIVNLNHQIDFHIGDQISLGDNDITLKCDVKFGNDILRFVVLEAKGKIYSNHGVTEPARINNREKLLIKKDLDLLDIVAKYPKQISDIVISFISTTSHVEQLVEALTKIFGVGKFPKITYKIETLKGVENLDQMLDKSKDLGLNPEIVIGCGDLESQVKEFLGKGASPKEIRDMLEEKIEEIVIKLSKRGVKRFSIAWGLGEGEDTTYKLRKIIGLGNKHGVEIDLWVTRATIVENNAVDVLKVLDGIISQRKIVLRELYISLAGDTVSDII